MARDDTDETWYECPCGGGEVYTYFSTPNHSFGKARSSADIRCEECRKRFRLPARLMFDTDETVLTSTKGGVEDVKLGALKTLRTRSNY